MRIEIQEMGTDHRLFRMNRTLIAGSCESMVEFLSRKGGVIIENVCESRS